MIYRQRFTPKGWVGVTLFILGPAIFGWLLTSFLIGPVFDKPNAMIVFLSGSLAPLGAMLALIGREYYDASAEIEREEHAKRNIGSHDAEKRKKAGI